MSSSQEIINLARENNGVLTTAMVAEAGLSRGSLGYLVDKGDLEYTARGVYTLPDAWEDEFVTLQSRYKRGIYSLDTALFLCGLTDQTPAKFHMTFPSTYNLGHPKRDGIQCSGAREPLYSLGIVEAVTPGGNKVRAYCAERTLCDILRPGKHVDIQVVTGAFRSYVTSKNKDIPLLSEYAQVVRVEDRLRPYLEVLL